MAMKALSTGKNSLVKFFKSAAGVASDAVSQVRGEGATSSLTSVKNAQDLAFAELEAYLCTQGPLIVTLYNSAAGLAARYKEEAERQRDFAVALRSLASVEGTTGPRTVGDGLNWVGVANYATCTSIYEQACASSELLVEKLADYVRGNQGVRDALEERASASAELVRSSAEVDRLRALITSLGGSHAANAAAEKAKAEAEHANALKRASDARAYHKKACEGLLQDVERMREGLKVDLQGILLDFCLIQLRTEQKISVSWEQILGKGLPVPVTSTPSGQ